jgi:hypothetical protein
MNVRTLPALYILVLASSSNPLFRKRNDVDSFLFSSLGTYSCRVFCRRNCIFFICPPKEWNWVYLSNNSRDNETRQIKSNWDNQSVTGHRLSFSASTEDALHVHCTAKRVVTNTRAQNDGKDEVRLG